MNRERSTDDGVRRWTRRIAKYALIYAGIVVFGALTTISKTPQNSFVLWVWQEMPVVLFLLPLGSPLSALVLVDLIRDRAAHTETRREGGM